MNSCSVHSSGVRTPDQLAQNSFLTRYVCSQCKMGRQNWSQNLGWCSGWGDTGEGCFGRERDSAQKMQASKSELTDALNKKYRVNLHRFYEPSCTSCRVRNFDVGVCCSLLGGKTLAGFVVSLFFDICFMFPLILSSRF